MNNDLIVWASSYVLKTKLPVALLKAENEDELYEFLLDTVNNKHAGKSADEIFDVIKEITQLAASSPVVKQLEKQKANNAALVQCLRTYGNEFHIEKIRECIELYGLPSTN